MGTNWEFNSLSMVMTGYFWTKLIALLVATGAILFPQSGENRTPIVATDAAPKVELANLIQDRQPERITRAIKIVVNEDEVCEISIFQLEEAPIKNKESFSVDVPSPRA